MQWATDKRTMLWGKWSDRALVCDAWVYTITFCDREVGASIIASTGSSGRSFSCRSLHFGDWCIVFSMKFPCFKDFVRGQKDFAEMDGLVRCGELFWGLWVGS